METLQPQLPRIERGSTLPLMSDERAAEKKSQRTIAALTGCVSKLSTLEQHKHAYFDALKDYAKIYAATQAYLADDALIAIHDYAPAIDINGEPDHGLIGDDGEPAAYVQISDDEIDSYGYLGWLRH
jgi:hypothetical protein